jgi:hypothetical protein
VRSFVCAPLYVYVNVCVRECVSMRTCVRECVCVCVYVYASSREREDVCVCVWLVLPSLSDTPPSSALISSSPTFPPFGFASQFALERGYPAAMRPSVCTSGTVPLRTNTYVIAVPRFVAQPVILCGWLSLIQWLSVCWVICESLCVPCARVGVIVFGCVIV